jgi:hypothetical protein
MKEGDSMNDILDPTIETARERIDYAARPSRLEGLRIGVIENTKKNSEAVLRKVAERLASRYGMTLELLLHKDQRAPLRDSQLAALKGTVDFAITGVGD